MKKNLLIISVALLSLVGVQAQTPIAITNGDFSLDAANATTGFTGWTVTKSDASSTTKVSTSAKGTPTFIVAAQNHAQLNRSGAAGAGKIDLSQSLTGLTNGSYTISADVVTSVFSYTGVSKLYANADSTLVPAQAAGSRLSVTTIVTDGNLKFGIGFDILTTVITLEVDNFTVVQDALTLNPSVNKSNISLYVNGNEVIVSSDEVLSAVCFNSTSGQQLLAKKLNAKNATVSLENLKSGVYLVTITTASNNKETKRVVVRK